MNNHTFVIMIKLVNWDYDLMRASIEGCKTFAGQY